MNVSMLGVQSLSAGYGQSSILRAPSSMKSTSPWLRAKRCH